MSEQCSTPAIGIGRTSARLSTQKALLYAAGSVGTGAFYAFNNFVLPAILKAFGAPDLLIGLLASTRSLEGAVIQPVVGALSDRVWTPLGRRRPFMLLAVPLSAALFIAGSHAQTLLVLAGTIVAFSIFFNIAVDPYVALLADVTPVEQRGWVSGMAIGVQLASSVAFLVLLVLATGTGGVPAWTYIVVAVLLVAGFGVTICGVSERRDSSPRRDQSRQRIAVAVWCASVLQHRQAVRFLGTLFVYQFGLNAITPYLVLFIIKDIHQTEQVAFALSAGLLVVTAFDALVFGTVADRIGTRAVLAIGWSLLTLSALAGVLITTLPETLAVVLLAGVGNGAAMAVSWPMLSALIPAEKTGVFAGLKAAAESIAIPLSVVVAAEVFLPHFGYRGIFAMLALSIITALVLLLRFVRVPSPSQPRGNTDVHRLAHVGHVEAC
jgi:maltose/moltooligosaccharide transporter